ncbi:MAG: hypothetical protein KJ915_13860 [Candidatus Omnitrophica bacterium]|nr:hypothetical protein [Candidatus Omnitrophota bacterium]
MTIEKPDRFGRFTSTIKSIHNNIFEKLYIQFCLEKKETELQIYQMSIFEYLEEKHDENYTYFCYLINNAHIQEGLMPSIFIAVNNKFKDVMFVNNFFKNDLPLLIVNAWNKTNFKSLDFYLKINKIACKTNDTIQSVHFFYKNEQLFKIMYSYNAVKEILISGDF